MNAPLSRYLTRFSSAEPAGAVGLEASAAEPMVTLGVAELDARLEEVRASVTAAADAALAQQRETLKQDHETAIADTLAAARADWSMTEGERIAALVEGAFVALHETLATGIAKAVRPLLAEAARERTIAALGAAIDRLLDDPTHPAITLSGPADLIAAVRAKRARAGLEVAVADTLEATIVGAGACIETKLAAALADLAATEI